MHHNIFHRPGITDLDVLRKQAHKRLNNRFGDPETTTIHFHAHGEKCNDECTEYGKETDDGEARS